MSKARCNALELKKEPRLMQDMPSEKQKSALHLTRLNDYKDKRQLNSWQVLTALYGNLPENGML
jgi:hypothetical protein